MKTKVIFLVAASSVLLYSCSTDREEEVVNPAAASKVELKKLEINQGNQASAKLGDSIVVAPPPKAMNSTNGDGEGLPPNPDQNEIIPPGDVKPPKP